MVLLMAECFGMPRLVMHTTQVTCYGNPKIVAELCQGEGLVRGREGRGGEILAQRQLSSKGGDYLNAS